ncbi:glycosyltransferase family 2 protein [Marinilactibacillus sp. Marseille-P9653]|uniref:glycosyltransferase family 2 protein n=1 Tax=Marinilactibacillus sp. Marseille-P9653 TaxID=2866583 RepID=UPI001CE42928|nr:glycosyltransferase family 2 protein [Marinilactibacillus sp. Marseille-P9653]
MKTLSVIIPAYNEEEVLPQLIERLNEVSEKLDRYAFEFLFVNDGSTDKTLTLLKELNKQDPRMKYVDLSRNFGKETAMLAGFDYATGDGIVILDADLQHPPEIMEEMIYWWEQGYEDIYAVRKKREGESFLKEWTSKTYYKVVQKMTPEKVIPQAGDFRLLDKKCIVALRQLREQERYTKGMYGWIGFKKKEIAYFAEERAAGKTKWNYSNLFKLAIDGITSYSTVPLKMWSYIGFVISVFAFVFLAVEIVKTIIYGTNVAGYPTLLAAILFLGGIQLISLGVIGEYLGRVFVETKGRPPYFIRESSEEDVEKEEQDDKPSA